MKPSGLIRARTASLCFVFQNGATSGSEMCFAPSTVGAGSQRFQPKHASNLDSVIKTFNPHLMNRPHHAPRRQPAVRAYGSVALLAASSVLQHRHGLGGSADAGQSHAIYGSTLLFTHCRHALDSRRVLRPAPTGGPNQNMSRIQNENQFRESRMKTNFESNLPFHSRSNLRPRPAAAPSCSVR